MSAGMDMSGNITQMLWKPKFIRLTQIGNPDWRGGKPTPCFVEPSTIVSIWECVAAFPHRDDPAKRHPDVDCTAVFFCHGTLHVLESAEQVAMLRDRALGHEPDRPKAA